MNIDNVLKKNGLYVLLIYTGDDVAMWLQIVILVL